MKLEFEVIRDEEEHRANPLHNHIKYWYNYYVNIYKMPKAQAIKYAVWNYNNVIKPQLERGSKKR